MQITQANKIKWRDINVGVYHKDEEYLKKNIHNRSLTTKRYSTTSVEKKDKNNLTNFPENLNAFSINYQIKDP